MTIDQGNEPSPGNPSAKMDSNISSPSSNPGDLPPPRHKPIPSTSFLFVNETGESSGYKKGYRRDIRSHVRKHAAKLNTRLKREASQSRLKSLVPQTPEQDDSEPPIDQEDSQSDLADASTPSFKNENSPLLMNCLPFRAPSVVPEWSTTSDCRAPTIQFITEPTIIGSPDASAPDCTGDYLCSCNLCGEKSNSSRSNQTAKRKAGSMIVKRQKLNKRPQLSPFSVLGAGRVDPFSSYPVSDPDNSLHELMDFGTFAPSHLILGRIPNMPLLKLFFN
jgi:hypothetical protein